MQSSSIIDYNALYNDFPVRGCAPAGDSLFDSSLSNTSEEVSFSGQRQRYCVCFIDMINSTAITSSLTDVQIGKYYSIFLNSTATIARNFGAKIIKNAGDCLIYYFPATSDSSDRIAFSDALECCSIMIEAHRFINAKLNEERLPPISYRISADYGMVEIARSITSTSDDLFGSTMNRCAKMNIKAKENSMVIGNDLYTVAKSFSSINAEYQFEEIWTYSAEGGDKQNYPIYAVQYKQRRIILNPFKCVSARLPDPILHAGSATSNRSETPTTG
jgi:two-component system, OmpR family, response regulator ChvI